MFFRGTGMVVGRGMETGTGAAQADARAARDATEALRADVERLLIITEALWTLLKEKHGYSDEELYRQVEEIDLRDGKLDGKVARSAPLKCPRCNRTLMGNRPACIYCGQEVQVSPFQR